MLWTDGSGLGVCGGDGAVGGCREDLTQGWKTFFSMSHSHKHVKSLQIHEKSELTSPGGMWN